MWRGHISNLAWSSLGAGPLKLTEVAENCDVFAHLLGPLPPATLPRGKLDI